MSKQQPIDQSGYYRELIEEQLQKIFRHPLFKESDVLKKFLEFIVTETLEGRSHCLKEYTIAVQALKKPLNFKPQENGIVRIHAGRLRRALKNYYEGITDSDEIRIVIPKGNYVPVFGTDIKDMDELDSLTASTQDDKPSPDESLTISVLPFTCTGNQQSLAAFCDGLCMQISSDLLHVRHTSVIAYQVVKSLVGSKSNFSEIATTLSSHYIVSGSVQRIANRLRLNIQLIRSKTSEQVWGGVYERKLTSNNTFELQDELAAVVVEEFRKSIVPITIRIPTPVAVVM